MELNEFSRTLSITKPYTVRFSIFQTCLSVSSTGILLKIAVVESYRLFYEGKGQILDRNLV